MWEGSSTQVSSSCWQVLQKRENNETFAGVEEVGEVEALSSGDDGVEVDLGDDNDDDDDDVGGGGEDGSTDVGDSGLGEGVDGEAGLPVDEEVGEEGVEEAVGRKRRVKGCCSSA